MGALAAAQVPGLVRGSLVQPDKKAVLTISCFFSVARKRILN